MFEKEDVLDEYIKKEENRGYPYWAITRALRRQGIKKEKIKIVMRRRIFRRKLYKNIVFFSEIVLWLLLIIIVSISSGDSILLITAAFSPIILSFLVSFYVVNNMKEKFLLFLVPFITTTIVFILFIIFAKSTLDQMDIASLSFINVAIGLIFNMFVYFVNDFKNVNVRPPENDERAEKIVCDVMRDSSNDIEALRKEFNSIRTSQKQIIHDLAEIKAEETPEIAKQKMVISTLHGKKFHKPSCIIMGEADSKNIIHFIDKDDALKKGYRPCKVCMLED